VEVNTNNSLMDLDYIGISIGTFQFNVTIDWKWRMLFLDDNGYVVFNNDYIVDIEAGAKRSSLAEIQTLPY